MGARRLPTHARQESMIAVPPHTPLQSRTVLQVWSPGALLGVGFGLLPPLPEVGLAKAGVAEPATGGIQPPDSGEADGVPTGLGMREGEDPTLGVTLGDDMALGVPAGVLDGEGEVEGAGVADGATQVPGPAAALRHTPQLEHCPPAPSQPHCCAPAFQLSATVCSRVPCRVATCMLTGARRLNPPALPALRGRATKCSGMDKPSGPSSALACAAGTCSTECNAGIFDVEALVP